jgi:lipoprotein
MKQFFLVMAALLSLAACKRDDDPAPSILGTWKFTGYKSINGVDGSVFNPYAADNCQEQDTFVFNTDGTAGKIAHLRSG